MGKQTKATPDSQSDQQANIDPLFEEMHSIRL